MAFLDLTIQSIAFRVLALLIIAGIHGGAVTGAATVLGDNGPKFDGRLTVLPTVHVDLVGAIGHVLFGMGWSKPVDIDARQFRIGRIGILVVILSGFVGLVATAALLDALIRPALTMLPYTAGLATAAFLRSASSLAIWFALLSLVPIPPLTGGLILGAAGIRVPPRARWILAALLFAAVASGLARRILGPGHAVLTSVVFGS